MLAFSWPRYLRHTLGAIVVLAGLCFAFVVAMNPYGHLPHRLFGPHVVMDINQRFQFPSIIKSGDFDSVVIGTSTSRLLDPKLLAKAFPGTFANLGMNNGQAWEQWQLMQMFLKETSAPKTLLVGIDTVWCFHNADADDQRITARGFPPWMYDDDPWNDWTKIFNAKAVEIAGRQAAQRLGFDDARLPPNGFDVFVNPDSEYDAERARRKIYKANRPHGAAPMRFPAVAWLSDILIRAPEGMTKLVVFMPAHLRTLPAPGSPAMKRDQQCKHEITHAARSAGAVVVDFRIPSELTREDTNFWDPVHWRLPVGTQIIDGVAAAMRTGRDAADGTYRTRAHPTLALGGSITDDGS